MPLVRNRERFPAEGGKATTTYMFAYTDAAQDRPSLHAVLSEYMRSLPRQGPHQLADRPVLLASQWRQPWVWRIETYLAVAPFLPVQQICRIDVLYSTPSPRQWFVQ
jgi:hypothetical protein